MKIVLILLCCIVGIMAQSDPQLDSARKSCLKGLKTLLQFEQAALCVAQKAGLLKANGDIDIDVVKQKLTVLVKDAKKVTPLVTKCAVKKGNAKATAVALFLCLVKEGVTYFLLQ